MAVGGFSAAGTSGGRDYEAKITPVVIISCLMAATGGLMFGYDIGISGGVTSMPDFLKKFFPVVYKRTQEKGLDSNYCKYDNQGLQLFTSSLYLAALIATFGASYTTRKLGRKPTMFIAGIFFIVGTILNAAAMNFLMLVLEGSCLVVELVLLTRPCHCSYRRSHQQGYVEHLTSYSNSMSPLAFSLQTSSIMALLKLKEDGVGGCHWVWQEFRQ